MNIFTCTAFTGHYPVGSAAIVQAKDAAEAADKLNAELREKGLPGDAVPEDMEPFPMSPVEGVRVLCDGNY